MCDNSNYHVCISLVHTFGSFLIYDFSLCRQTQCKSINWLEDYEYPFFYSTEFNRKA